jgi:hydroxymethylbilane synthase
VIRLGTRGSALALRQAEMVAEGLRARGADVEIVTIRTEGDRRVDQRLAEVGGKGLFVREIEVALTDERIDIAVHSLKDLPADVAPGLTLGAYLEREDPRDLLVTKAGGSLATLPRGAVIGTSSPRRRALLLALRADLRIEPLRGNVDTRLGKLAEGGFHGIVLAAAGVKRLGLGLANGTPLDPDVFVPAIGQGVIAVEAREDDPATLRALQAIDAAATRVVASAERAYLARLGASCVTPMAAHATLRGDRLRIAGFVADDDGRRVLRAAIDGAPRDAALLGRRLADALLGEGAAAITPLAPDGRHDAPGRRAASERT